MSVTSTLSDGVLRVTIDRPEVRNAFDDIAIEAITAAFVEAGRDPAIRVVLLAATGTIFSAGGDLRWMERQSTRSADENRADAGRLAAMMRAVDRCPKPTVVRVHGSAFAGAVGLIACCDIAVAVAEAEFAITEVRLGLIPAVIGPYLVRAMGARQARRFLLTAERFSAAQALTLNLLHEVVAPDALDARIAALIAALAAGGPEALAECKALINDVDRPIDDDLVATTADRIARVRGGKEAREGIAAFLAKCKPAWR